MIYIGCEYLRNDCVDVKTVSLFPNDGDWDVLLLWPKDDISLNIDFDTILEFEHMDGLVYSGNVTRHYDMEDIIGFDNTKRLIALNTLNLIHLTDEELRGFDIECSYESGKCSVDLDKLLQEKKNKYMKLIEGDDVITGSDDGVI